MKVVAHSERLHELIAPDAQVERIASGFGFVEGPVWNAEDRYLLFTDIPAARIHRWTGGATAGVWRSQSNMANGLTFDNELLLLACEHATSRVTRTESDGTVTVLASHYEGRELNSPNDVIVARDGSILFTDPMYGRYAEHGVEREPELPFRGVYRIAPRGGQLELLLDDFEAPNGLCFSPDESLLYVDDSERCHVRVFDWRDSSPQNGRVLIEQPGGSREAGKCDGVKCDARGNIWVTAPGGIWIVSPEGEHLGSIELPAFAANLSWGGDDWRTLFVCASDSVYRVETLVGGNLVGYMRRSPLR